jgi:hypothetical protein
MEAYRGHMVAPSNFWYYGHLHPQFPAASSTLVLQSFGPLLNGHARLFDEHFLLTPGFTIQPGGLLATVTLTAKRVQSAGSSGISPPAKRQPSDEPFPWPFP